MTGENGSGVQSFCKALAVAQGMSPAEPWNKPRTREAGSKTSRALHPLPSLSREK